MAFERGDIVEVSFLIPHNNRLAPHPAVIISSDEVYEADGCYICVMLTTQNIIDRFSFEITDDMLLKPSNKPFSQARCHLVTYITQSHIIQNNHSNKMKPNAVNRLVDRIAITALSQSL